jgi:predicted NBD/HSP70 family sugar kinase
MQIPNARRSGPQDDLQRPLACIEIGGGSIQTVLFGLGDRPQLLDGARQPKGSTLALAVPGLISGGIVVHASNLDWRNVDPVERLGLQGPAELVMNDAEAAALGEGALRGSDGLAALVYVCVGTGIGGAVIRDGEVLQSNLFGHNAEEYGTAFGDIECRCGRRGCLETVASGWALPDPLSDDHLHTLADLLATAITSHPLADDGTIVIGGGIARRYPRLVTLMKPLFDDRSVEHTLAPYEAKSAAAWGLRYSLHGEVEALV